MESNGSEGTWVGRNIISFEMRKKNIRIWDKIQITLIQVFDSNAFSLNVIELLIQSQNNGGEMGVSKTATDQFACHH